MLFFGSPMSGLIILKHFNSLCKFQSCDFRRIILSILKFQSLNNINLFYEHVKSSWRDERQ